MDLAKLDYVLPSVKQAEDWDLVIVDEAHRMSARDPDPNFSMTWPEVTIGACPLWPEPMAASPSTGLSARTTPALNG